MKDIAFEHRFWLQIMGDHGRFIFESLAPLERQDIQTANAFIQQFDRFLEEARKEHTANTAKELARVVYEPLCLFRDFKLSLIRRHLQGKVSISLSPTFINHMVNELEEYQRILKSVISSGKVPVYHPVHHHQLWLLDAAGHAGSISADLDLIEKKLKKKSETFQKHFEDFYLKAVEMAGYLRTSLHSFPALARFNDQTKLEMTLFKQFLEELEEMRISNEALGVLSPLMADHMFREECYYLTKLAQVSDLKAPACDPTAPRQVK